GRKLPVSNPRHPQLQCANPCLEFLAPVPVPVPLTVLGPLIALGLQLLRDLGFEDLLDYGFDEPGQAVVALKQSSHHVLVYGNLELGHRISSSGCVGGYLNPFGGTVAYPVCSQATSLLHSVSDAIAPCWFRPSTLGATPRPNSGPSRLRRSPVSRSPHPTPTWSCCRRPVTRLSLPSPAGVPVRSPKSPWTGMSSGSVWFTAASSGSSAGSCRCRWPCPSGSTPRCRRPWPTAT